MSRHKIIIKTIDLSSLDILLILLELNDGSTKVLTKEII